MRYTCAPSAIRDNWRDAWCGLLPTGGAPRDRHAGCWVGVGGVVHQVDRRLPKTMGDPCLLHDLVRGVPRKYSIINGETFF